MILLAAFCAGIALCAFLPELPDGRWLGPALAGAAVLAWRLDGRGRQAALWLMCGLAGLGYAGWRAELRLADALAPQWEGRPVEFVAVVRGLPDPGDYGVRLNAEVEQVLTPGARLPARVQLNAYRGGDWPAGSRWRLTARFKARHATANPFGFDGEAWMWSEGLQAGGSVGKGAVRLDDAKDALAYIDRLRAAVQARLQRVLGETREAVLIGALTVGAQQAIAREDWQRFSRTGLTHLVSISGLHITMVAGLAALLAAGWLRLRPTVSVPPRLVIAAVTVLAALGYALLAGFSVPTQRTLFMLACAAVLLASRRAYTPFQVWWLALTVVLLIDPFSVLAPGLWLSFGLVAALMAATLARRRPPGKLRAALAGQWAALVMSLLPLALFFGNLPLVSPFANAVAIPYISALVTPLALAAVALPFDAPLHWAAWLAEGFFWAVDKLAVLPPWSIPGLPWPLLMLGALGSLWLIAPRGVPLRAFGALLLTPALLYSPPRPAPATLRVQVFDVGQGLSVLLQTAHHDLLYDTGPGEAERVLLPQLAGLGVRRLDALMLSHHDSDHDAAAAGLLAALPVARVWAGQPETLAGFRDDAAPCQAGQSWAWDGVRFDVLWPPEGLTGEDNAHSCVLRVATMTQAVLLPGDIGQREEDELVLRYGRALASDVLLAPHHGSRGASGEALLQAVTPRWGVFSAGYRNRYRHPHPQTLERYRAQGTGVLRTDQLGALRIELGREVGVSAFRLQAPRYWRARPDAAEDKLTAAGGR
ncbi:DNA internalization-related competence protein ComEC/Rec2 [Pseudogulbenkiania sp. MAI-1]|uniref:DNA internalization-related competence protein ComEC/Rec2 n=1 Tax=Pseudogulbenkiania sp. MAI-1 TaxID=990370 RepID=UPI00045E671F|nr:DNA internalization-related competence protein ComEC/Rec2 [Pseudogulbenkiania sp. MAI-1]